MGWLGLTTLTLVPSRQCQLRMGIALSPEEFRPVDHREVIKKYLRNIVVCLHCNKCIMD